MALTSTREMGSGVRLSAACTAPQEANTKSVKRRGLTLQRQARLSEECVMVKALSANQLVRTMGSSLVVAPP